jgi:hypothetical protein
VGVERIADRYVRRLQERLGVIYERLARAEDAGDGDRQLYAVDGVRMEMRATLVALDEWRLKAADAAQTGRGGEE